MKISSSLVKAMLLSATLGVTAVGCKSTKTGEQEKAREKARYERKHPGHDCPGCGMG